MSRLMNYWKQRNNTTKLVILSVIAYSVILLFHYIFTHFIDPNFSILVSDQINFYNRGKGIIQGQLPYRDFYTNAAPLSPYFWAPFILISMVGSADFSSEFVNSSNYANFPSMILSAYVLRIFFALCLILSGLILLKLEEKKGNKHAFLISLFYTVNPFFLYLVSFWGSDECIVPLLILLPIYLYERRNYTLATLSIVLGAGLKYFPILLAPLIWIYSKDWSERIMQTMLFIGFLFLVTLPFYLIAPENFLYQFQDLIGEKGNQGLFTIVQSYFSLDLNQFNYIFQILSVAAVCLIGIYLFLHKEKWHYQRTAALLLPLLFFYPKIQVSYYSIVLPFIFFTLFLKGIFRWISLTLLAFGASMGVIANYLIINETGLLVWDSLAWIAVLIFYLSLLVMLYLVLLKDYYKGEENSTNTISANN